MELKLTFDLLPVLSAVMVILAWVTPGFKTWYEALMPEKKQLLMLGVLLVIAAVTSALSYFGLVTVYPVDQGLKGLVWYPIVDFVIALSVNAGVYKATNYVLRPKKE